MITILLALAALQQPPQQPAPARRASPAVTAPQAESPAAGMQPKTLRTAFDSTVAAVSDIGVKVSEVRSGYDVFRMSVFNQSDGAVAERAQQLGGACRAVIAAIQTGARTMCRSCVAGQNHQAALDQWRATLPGVQRTAQQCATRMPGATARPTAAQIASLRKDVRTIGSQLIAGLTQYEQRLNTLRVAMGWATPPMPTPRRGNR
jgi:hypothetical protein